MKRTLILISGILLIILAGLAIWAYVFINGTPISVPGLNTDFSTSQSPPQDFSQPQDSNGDNVPREVSITSALTQLTTRPVAGATFTVDGIRYAERGTGHIYDIVFSTGREERRSVTTVPRVTQAIFSPEGGRVVLVSESGEAHEAVVATITRNDGGDGSLDGMSLPSGAREIAFNDQGTEVLYLLNTNDGSTGYAYNIAEQTNRELFSIPLQDVRIIWGNDIYMYTTPSAHSVGHIYRIVGDTLEYVTEGGRSLMATGYNEGLVVAKRTQDDIVATAYERENIYTVFLDLFPEKCTPATIATSTLYCGAPLDVRVGGYPDDWYKGALSYSDFLWKVDIQGGTLELLLNIKEIAGRAIDIAHVGIDEEEQYIYFTDKNDDTLWLFNKNAQ